MNLYVLAGADAVLRHLPGVLDGGCQIAVHSQAARGRLGVDQPMCLLDRCVLSENDMEIKDIIDWRHIGVLLGHEESLLRAAAQRT